MVSGQPSLGFWARGLFRQKSFGFIVRQGRLNDVRKQYRLWYQKGVNTVQNFAPTSALRYLMNKHPEVREQKLILHKTTRQFAVP
jgi:hypothetical protein